MKKLYKYRSFFNNNDIDATVANDRNVRMLFEQKGWVSSRKAFNDPFDSHINFRDPLVTQIQSLIPKINIHYRHIAESWIKDRKFTSAYRTHVEELHNRLTDLIDRYGIYCFSSSPDNNLLWSHYGMNHTGFCIEFDRSKIATAEVAYRNNLYDFSVLNLLKLGEEITDLKVGKQMTEGINTKLNHWRYEEERRIVLPGKFSINATGVEYPYPHDAITSVIFGNRTTKANQKYIMEYLPYKVQYKKAQIDRKNSRIAIVMI